MVKHARITEVFRALEREAVSGSNATGPVNRLRRLEDSDNFYREATGRNLGLLTEAEQEVLRNSTVAIAGVGAVGGHYLLTLARMGVGGFRIADPDSFDVANLQRQAGAFTHTLGRSKVEVMAEMIRAVNPEVRIRVFPEGLTEENADEFLDGADLALDGIDFFQIDARRLLFRKARAAGIHAVTSGPIGYGASLQIFDPQGMTFDEYFGITPEMTRAERLALFGAGLLPRIPRSGSMDSSRVDFETEKGPALASSIMLCAGVMSCEAMRILLGRGQPRCVPHAFYFDPYNREYVQSKSSRNASRLFRWLVRRVAFRRFPSLLQLHRSETAAGPSRPVTGRRSVMARKIRRILKAARRMMRSPDWRGLFSGPGVAH